VPTATVALRAAFATVRPGRRLVLPSYRWRPATPPGGRALLDRSAMERLHHGVAPGFDLDQQSRPGGKETFSVSAAAFLLAAGE